MFTRFRALTPEAAQGVNQVGDFVVLGVAAHAGAVHGADPRVFDWHVAVTMFASATIFWLLSSRVLRQYDTKNGRGYVGDIALTLVMIAVVVASIAFVGLVVFPGTGMRLVPFAATLAVATVFLRETLIGRRLRRQRPLMNVVIAGVGSLGRLTGTEILEGGSRELLMGYVRFDDEKANKNMPASALGSIGELQALLQNNVVDEVYFASMAGQHEGAVQNAIRTCERLGVTFALPVCPYRLGRAKPATQKAATHGYVHYHSVQVKPLQVWMKRLFDIVASGMALILLAPVLFMAALAVKLTSPGPVLFRQERVGLHGRTFQMLKFRSMVANAEQMKLGLIHRNEQSGPVFKIAHDPRVTAVGRFIRKYSIDELPQLVNVLRGDMTVVGPRPPLASEVARYETWQRRRLSVRPGLTCVWQVSGRSQISFKDWMLLDMQYIDHWNLAMDFNLILRTVPAVLAGRGAH